ncbi:MAG TPA: PilZ domain-containing protein [Polyangiaceae bacterium]|nr:PilZ domain-containing protein [Polyangiaceae bacterium]
MTSTSALKARAALGNRRSHGRAKLCVPVLLDTARSYFKAFSKDVSESGIGIEVGGPVGAGNELEVGRCVELYFELPTGSGLELSAEVVRSEDDGIGLTFRGLSPEASQALKHYCEQWKAELIQRCRTRASNDSSEPANASAASVARSFSARPIRAAQPAFYDDSEMSSEIRIRYR